MKKIAFVLLMLWALVTPATAQVTYRPSSRTVGTVLTSSTAQVGTDANLTEKTLWSWDLPADTLTADGQAIRIRAVISTAANVNSKTVRMYFGATLIKSRVTTVSGAGIILEGVVHRTGASAQYGSTNDESTGGSADVGLTTPAENLAGPVTIRVTGQNAVATANDIVLRNAVVEFLSSGIFPASGTTASSVLAPDGNAASPAYAFTNDPDTGFYRTVGGIVLSTDGAFRHAFTTGGISVNNNAVLVGEAADTLAQRNGTNAQTFRLYGTFTDASNYERLRFTTAAGTNEIVTEAAGTGTIRSLRVGTNSAASLVFRTGGTDRWFMDSSGHLLGLVDSTYDIGASGANRPRHYYGAGNVIAGGYLHGPALYLGTGGYGSISMPSDGVIRLIDNAGTSFNRLQFGGTTSSFPALKRSGNTLQLRTADDTAYVYLYAGGLQSNTGLITGGSGAGITVDNVATITRQVYKVTVNKDAFVCAGLTCDVTIATLPAKTWVQSVLAELTQVFACQATCTSTTLSMTAGYSAGSNNIFLSFDADAATMWVGDQDAELGGAHARASAVQGGTFSTAGSLVTIRLTSGTGNIGDGVATNLSQGSITFYLSTERLP